MPRRWIASAGLVVAMSVVLYAVPLALAERLDPRVSLLALMAIDAAIVALVVRSAGTAWAGVAVVALLGATLASRAVGWFALPSIATFGALALGFGWTLRPGAVPIATAIAREVHGPATTAALERYARGLTIAWAACFGALAAGSATLAAAASFEAWTTFVNLLSWPLIGAMFVAEWVVRRLRFRHLPATTPAQVVAAVVRFSARGAAGGSDAQGATAAGEGRVR